MLSRFLFSAALLFSFILPVSVYSQSISLQKPTGFKVEKIEGKKLVISFNIKIENASSKGIGVTVKKGQLYKDGELLGTFKLLEKVKLKKHSNEGIPIRVQVDLDKELDILKHIQTLLMKPVELRLKGKIKATWFILWKKYPFEYAEKISVQNFLK